MNLHRPHATAAITALCLAGAVGANIFTLNWRGHFLAYAGASLLLASPFAVLLAGHLTVAKTWRRSTFLAVGSVLLALAWWFASFLMRWFQPGWGGAVFFGLVLSSLAVLYILLSLVIREAA
jgi:hypothetical protein